MFFSIVWRNCVICLKVYGEDMVNLITRMASMVTEWRHCGESYYLWRFYGKISLLIVWVFMEKTW